LIRRLWKFVLDCLTAVAEDDAERDRQQERDQYRYLDWLNYRPP